MAALCFFGYYYMFEQKDEKLLWGKMEVNEGKEEEDQYLGRSGYSSAVSDGSRRKREETPKSMSGLESQPPFAPASVQQPYTQRDIATEQNDFHRHLYITQEESHIEQIIRMRESPSVMNSIDYEHLEQYNEEISQMPQSVTPLVYSKNSKRGDVRFRKETAKVIILKLRLAEAKEMIEKLREQCLSFAVKIREEHELLQYQICGKYFQLLGEYSMRFQESVFMHKQDYQQLKYELEVRRSKEETMNCPVNSQLYVQNTNNNQPRQQNDELKVQIGRLMSEKEKLSRDGESFKRKIAEIESKTEQIKLSNEKLYEYVFDLQQKIAYYKEEMPKVAVAVREQAEKRLQEEVQRMSSSHYEEINKSMEQIQMLQSENLRLSEDLAHSNEASKKLEKDYQKLKASYKQKEEQLSLKDRELQSKISECSNLQVQIKKLKSDLQKSLKDKDDVQQWKEQQKRESTSRLSRAYSIKQDKKLIEALQIQRLVLQKQNIQLKATMQFYNKSQPHYIPNYASQKTFTTNYEQPQNYQNHQAFDQKDRELQIKEKELFQLQNYLQEQARKIESRQRDIDSQYLAKRTQQHKFKEYAMPATTRIVSHDDYGMKNMPINPAKTLQQRKNHFCSSQAQAIIEKVKMRQKLKENGCGCIQPRNCHCQTYSRGSRNSQDSNPREVARMQHHRPSNYSPAIGGYQYVKKEEKSSKMKLIQQKVRRLKSQLKSSFTTMKI